MGQRTTETLAHMPETDDTEVRKPAPQRSHEYHLLTSANLEREKMITLHTYELPTLPSILDSCIGSKYLALLACESAVYCWLSEQSS